MARARDSLLWPKIGYSLLEAASVRYSQRPHQKLSMHNNLTSLLLAGKQPHPPPPAVAVAASTHIISILPLLFPTQAVDQFLLET